MSRRVLVVDDDVSLTQFLKTGLGRLDGWTVRAENDGAHALDAVKDFRPDVVILDVAMPDMDGIAVAQSLRADPTARQTPIVFLTSLPSEKIRGACVSGTGRVRWMEKPVSVASLVEEIDMLLGDTRKGPDGVQGRA